MPTYMSKVAVVEGVGGEISITRFALEDMVSHRITDEATFRNWYMNRVFPNISFIIIDEADIPKRPDGQWDKSKRNKWRLNAQGKVFADNSIELPTEARARKLNSARAKLISGQPLSVEEADELVGRI